MIRSKRIVSLLPSATEILFAIEAGEQVVGVSHECDHPPGVERLPRLTFSRVDCQQDSAAIDRQVNQNANSGAALYEVDARRIIELNPDTIVTQSQCDVCAVRYQDVLDLVARTPELEGTSVVALSPMSLEEVFQDVLRVGAAVGADSAAKRLVGSLESRVEAVSATARGAGERPRVACVEWTDPLMLAANWMPQLIELAAGQSCVTDSGHGTYSAWDRVLEFDPELIVVMPCGFDLPRAAAEAAVLERLPGWSELSAARNGRVYAADGNAYFNRSGPRLVDSLEMLAHLIHPDRFPRAGLSSGLADGFRELSAQPT